MALVESSKKPGRRGLRTRSAHVGWWSTHGHAHTRCSMH